MDIIFGTILIQTGTHPEETNVRELEELADVIGHLYRNTGKPGIMMIKVEEEIVILHHAPVIIALEEIETLCKRSGFRIRDDSYATDFDPSYGAAGYGYYTWSENGWTNHWANWWNSEERLRNEMSRYYVENLSAKDLELLSYRTAIASALATAKREHIGSWRIAMLTDTGGVGCAYPLKLLSKIVKLRR